MKKLRNMKFNSISCIKIASKLDFDFALFRMSVENKKSRGAKYKRENLQSFLAMGKQT